MKELSDEELLRLCGEDNLNAYNELFDRYYLKVSRLSNKYVKDSMLAEELSMDLLFGIWQKRNSLLIKKDFSAYLFRAIRNSVIDHLRKKVLPTRVLDLMDQNELVTDLAADSDLLSTEIQNVYQQKLNALSPQRRKVFQLSREENMSYKEIANEMNLSVNTVENYMVSALATLRHGMSEYSNATLLIAGITTLHTFL